MAQDLTPTLAQRRRLPAMRATEMIEDPVAHVRFFFGGRGAFYATEYDHATGEMFGFMVSVLGPDCDELGYLTLRELQATQGMLFGGAERDLHFTPAPLSEIRGRYHANRLWD